MPEQYASYQHETHHTGPGQLSRDDLMRIEG